MQDQALRIDLPDGQFSGQQWQNLFWIKSGYVYFVSGTVMGEQAARAVRLMEQWLPVREVQLFAMEDGGAGEPGLNGLENLRNAEEVFYVEPGFDLVEFPKISREQNWPVFAVRQIGRMQFGNVRVLSRRLRVELA